MHKRFEREIEEAEVELRSASESQTDRLTALKNEKERYKAEGKALNDQLEEIKVSIVPSDARASETISRVSVPASGSTGRG